LSHRIRGGLSLLDLNGYRGRVGDGDWLGGAGRLAGFGLTRKVARLLGQARDLVRAIGGTLARDGSRRQTLLDEVDPSSRHAVHRRRWLNAAADE
jgi:hypothetical protein